MDLVLEADVALVRGAHPHPTDDAIRVIIAAVYDSIASDGWESGYYDATNGKWGPPPGGLNPYKRAS